ncbi:chemotaxis protein [Photobacterium ganghwense]|uniref:chemotaxis protein n=1 Tax=Photobacterium ganghwense TaxID=320778 RepID=UPI0039EF0DFC
MGRSKSQKSSNTTNVSGTNGIDGDNLGVAISGVNGSNINVNLTDHGAITRASEMGELAITANTQMARDALDSNTDVSKAALRMGSETVDRALDFGESALDYNSELSMKAINDVSNAHHENLQMVAGLAGNQAAQNSENLAALKDLAAMNSDGGQVATTKQMTIMVGLVFFFLAMMTIFRKGK